MSITIQGGVDAVREFHVKHGFSNGLPFPTKNNRDLQELGEFLVEESKVLCSMALKEPEGSEANISLMRSHLILEEAAEAFRALGDCDEVKFLDALGDLCYVVFGSAVSYDLPLSQAFDEIQSSNMTKQAVQDDPERQRLRNKGPNYRAPDLHRVLLEYRSRRGRDNASTSGDRHTVYLDSPDNAGTPKSESD